MAIGNFYCDGIGVGVNIERAKYWYGRAYKQGFGPAANNLGTLYRDEEKRLQAARWFKRAVALGDKDADLELAKVLLSLNDRETARHCLQRLSGAKYSEATQWSVAEARRLLRQLRREPSGRMISEQSE